MIVPMKYALLSLREFHWIKLDRLIRWVLLVLLVQLVEFIELL
jgi:hypothetical protein